MLEKRYYNIESLLSHQDFKDSLDFVFIGNSNEQRSLKVHSLLSDRLKAKKISVNYDIEFEKFSLVEFKQDFKVRNENLESTGLNLVQDLIPQLNSIGVNNKTLLVDITSIKHPFLFYLLLIFKRNFNIKKLFICYSEPESYSKNESDIKNGIFDLTERFCEISSIPGFLRLSDYSKEKILVALMGFEGNRFNKAFNEINPAPRKTHAIVGFPSFFPSWQYWVYSQNQNVLEQSKAYSLMHRVTANEPFGVYNILEKLKINNLENEMYIAPIGTKPHSLGACMFAIDNTDVQIYYDFPSYGKKLRTKGVGQSFVYNLTDFINDK
jgi:hypothetical protein